MILWVGFSVSPDWVQSVFGVQSAAQIDIDKTSLQDLDNPLSRRVRSLIKRIREDRCRHMKVGSVRFYRTLNELHSVDGHLITFVFNSVKMIFPSSNRLYTS
jgi:hypothetical protein